MGHLQHFSLVFINSMQTALITGASSGIGKALAHELASRGCNLILTARNVPRLQEVAQEIEKKYTVQVTIISCDLLKPHAAASLYKEISAKQLSVDILINNAGFGLYGAFAQSQIEHDIEMIQVNITALTELTSLVLPSMKKQGHGRIMQVASTAAFQSGPYMAVYFATKAYVLSFAEALSSELAGTGISVTALCPGPTETGFESRAASSGIPIFKSSVMSPALVAKKGVDALLSGKSIIVPGTKNSLLIFLNRLVPRWLVRKVMKQILTP